MPDLRPVYSDSVSHIGHDPETGELHVVWQNGRTSIYSGVPEQTAETVINAPSVGQALNEHIKNSFGHRYG